MKTEDRRVAPWSQGVPETAVSHQQLGRDWADSPPSLMSTAALQNLKTTNLHYGKPPGLGCLAVAVLGSDPSLPVLRLWVCTSPSPLLSALVFETLFRGPPGTLPLSSSSVPLHPWRTLARCAMPLTHGQSCILSWAFLWGHIHPSLGPPCHYLHEAFL